MKNNININNNQFHIFIHVWLPAVEVLLKFNINNTEIQDQKDILNDIFESYLDGKTCVETAQDINQEYG